MDATPDDIPVVPPPDSDSLKPEYWTVAQVAAVIQMSPSFVTAEIRSGELPASRLGGRWRIASADVAQYRAAKRFPVSAK